MDTTLERMFASQNKFDSVDSDFADFASGQDESGDTKTPTDKVVDYQHFVDTEWARLFEKATDYMHTSIFATTGNQLYNNLRKLASRIGHDVSQSHRKAIVIQIVSNRDEGVTTEAMFTGEMSTL